MHETRLPGYYWVVFAVEWEPAFWSGEHWLLLDDIDTYQDDGLKLIGSYLVMPNQTDLFRADKPSLIRVRPVADEETLLEQTQQQLEHHHGITPTDKSWGLYFAGDDSPAMGGGVGAFYWFGSKDEMLRFIVQVLPFNPPGPAHDNPLAKQHQVSVISEAIRMNAISDEQGIIQLNKALKGFSCIEWWGTLEMLTTGQDNFAKRVVSAFEMQEDRPLSLPLRGSQRSAWLAFLSEYGL
ncbi:hypothetical protein ACU6TU_03160 [Halomonas sp. LS-001]